MRLNTGQDTERLFGDIFFDMFRQNHPEREEWNEVFNFAKQQEDYLKHISYDHYRRVNKVFLYGAEKDLKISWKSDLMLNCLWPGFQAFSMICANSFRGANFTKFIGFQFTLFSVWIFYRKHRNEKNNKKFIAATSLQNYHEGDLANLLQDETKLINYERTQPQEYDQWKAKENWL